MLLPIETMGRELTDTVEEIELVSLSSSDMDMRAGNWGSPYALKGPTIAEMGDDEDGTEGNPFFETTLGAPGPGSQLER